MLLRNKIDYIIIRAVKVNAKKQQGLYTIRRLLVLQLGLTLFIATIAGLALGSKAAYSSWLAGMVCIIPNACFASILFRHRGARAAKKIVNSFYKAETFKFILTMILFVAVFVSYSIVPLVFFLTYILVQLTHWFAPWVLANKRNRPESE